MRLDQLPVGTIVQVHRDYTLPPAFVDCDGSKGTHDLRRYDHDKPWRFVQRQMRCLCGCHAQGHIFQACGCCHHLSGGSL